MTALALPLALVLGVLAGFVSGLVRRMSGRERSSWADFRGAGRDARLLLRGGKERATPLELGGAVASMLGSTLAAAAAIGEVPDSLGLVYLALLGAAAGLHIAALDASTALREAVVARSRQAWVAAEPGFVLGLTAAMARWRATDLDGVRGAQEVLGAGPAVGPPMAAIGLVAAAAVLLVAGALRLLPASEGSRGRGRRAGGALLIAVCRWSLAGATSLVAAVLLVGGSLRTSGGAVALDALLPPALVAVGCAALLGVVDGLVTAFAGRRGLVAAAAFLVAAGAAVAVAVA